jgi:ABC-type dipeptide/oligopeptide/nickel transport system permease component
MLSYAARRILLLVPVLLAVATVTFVLLQLLPGDPVLSLVGERYDDDTVARIRSEMGLDQPLPVRYAAYLGSLLHGDLGRSFSTREPVARLILERFPKTLELALAAMLVAVVLGIAGGALGASRKGTWWDRASTVTLVGASSVPVFWWGLLLILVVSVWWGLLPASGYGEGRLRYLVLPALTLATNSTALLARVTRSAFLEALGEPYVRTARAKGLRERVVVGKHAFRNASIPVVTVVGTDFGSYLSGAVLTESIFGWPGLGRFTLDAILSRDFPSIQGAVLFMAALFVVVNLAVDLVYAWADPRIRLGARAE